MASIRDFADVRLEQLLSWARYLYWANLQKQRFDDCVADHDESDNVKKWRFIALLSMWYASLWVVIEGWESIPLADPHIDEIIKAGPKYKRMLRRFRNGVYHYQLSLTDRRNLDFLNASGGFSWSHLLHEEFCRFYWELFEAGDIPASLRPKFRKSIKGMVGWIPDKITVAKIDGLRKLARKNVKRLERAKDFTSEPARGLLDAVGNCIRAADGAQKTFSDWKASMLLEIRRNGAES